MESDSWKPLKSCFFKGCPNTSLNCNRKLFLRVPKKRETRTFWYQCARNTTKNIPKTSEIFCCEDHFDLQTDCENWEYFKTFGLKLAIKKGVGPRKIERNTSSKEESQFTESVEKRKNEIMSELLRRKYMTDSDEGSSSPVDSISFEPSEHVISATPKQYIYSGFVQSPFGKFSKNQGQKETSSPQYQEPKENSSPHQVKVEVVDDPLEIAIIPETSDTRSSRGTKRKMPDAAEWSSERGSEHIVTSSRQNAFEQNNSSELHEHEVVGMNVSKKLMRMDPTQAVYAESLIHQVLMKGLLNQLSANTILHDFSGNAEETDVYNLPRFKYENPCASPINDLESSDGETREDLHSTF